MAPAAGFIQESTVGGPVRERAPLGAMRLFKSLSVAAESYRVQPFQKGADSRQNSPCAEGLQRSECTVKGEKRRHAEAVGGAMLLDVGGSATF